MSERAAGGDRIELRGLRALGVCGALPEEQERAQPLEVDLDIVADLSVAGESDDLDDTVDYGAVCDTVAKVIDGFQPKLLEHLADRVGGALLHTYLHISAVTVTVRKLRPPVPYQLESSGVRVHRDRAGIRPASGLEAAD